MTGPPASHAILDVVIEGQKTAHSSILAEYQQDPIRGTISHIDLRRSGSTSRSRRRSCRARRRVRRRRRLAACSPWSRVRFRVEALPVEVPEQIERRRLAMEIGDVAPSRRLPADESVTYLDDRETVLATVTVPRGFRSPKRPRLPRRPRRGRRGPRARRARRRASGRRVGGRRQSPSPRSSPCGSSVGASLPRRSICSWRGSATPAASTSATVTTSAGWSSTSSRGGTAASFRSKFSGRIAETRIDGAGWRS